MKAKKAWAPTDDYLFGVRKAMQDLLAAPATPPHQRRALRAHLKHVRGALLARGFLV